MCKIRRIRRECQLILAIKCRALHGKKDHAVRSQDNVSSWDDRSENYSIAKAPECGFYYMKNNHLSISSAWQNSHARWHEFS